MLTTGTGAPPAPAAILLLGAKCFRWRVPMDMTGQYGLLNGMEKFVGVSHIKTCMVFKKLMMEVSNET